MSMTPKDIVSAALKLPSHQVAEIVDRLALTLPTGSEVDEAWRQETSRRMAEIEAGTIEGIPGHTVAEEVRRIVGR